MVADLRGNFTMEKTFYGIGTQRRVRGADSLLAY
jgi:hypothetical protein